MTSNDVLAAALGAEAAGISVLPPREDGTKQPIDKWTPYKTFDEQCRALKRMSVHDLEDYYTFARTGVGWVLGKASRHSQTGYGLEVLDFDDRPTYEGYKKAAFATGLGAIVDRIERGYLEATPKGGRHWPYYCPEIAGNTKLARRPGPVDECGNRTVLGLIETRGEGGYVVVAPSWGKVHSSGKPYELLSGSTATVATITSNERRALWALARTFDEMPKPKVHEQGARPNSTERAGERPGDDFNRRARWQDVLKGWVLVYECNGVGYWRRPGKSFGVSATTGYGDSDYLYCFSTSTAFESERGYSKFSAYALLHHDGDFAAAAKALAAKGYGSTEEHVSSTLRTCHGADVARTIRTAPAREVASWLS